MNKTYKLETKDTLIINTSKFLLEDIYFEKTLTYTPKKYAIAIIIEGDNKGCEYYFDEPHTFYGNSRILFFQGGENNLICN